MRKNYFVLIIYAQIYLQIFKRFDEILFFFIFTKFTFFQAVKLVVPLKQATAQLGEKLFVVEYLQFNCKKEFVFCQNKKVQIIQRLPCITNLNK